MRIIIVEDNELLRNNLTLLLGGEHDIMVTRSFGSSEDAIDGLRDIDFDLLLVDIGLPGLSGIELIRRVKERNPEIDILAHTVFDDRDTIYKAIRAGASGYILKGATPRELVEAIRNLVEGGAPMSPRIARAIIHDMQEKSGEEQYILTARETEIIRRLESGYTYNEAADELNISSHTVHTHIKHIYEKLHAKDRKDALIKARKKGII